MTKIVQEVTNENENSYKILQYLKENNGATAIEVSEATGIQKRLVDSYFSAGIIKNGYGERDLTTTPTRLILNDAGLVYEQ